MLLLPTTKIATTVNALLLLPLPSSFLRLTPAWKAHPLSSKKSNRNRNTNSSGATTTRTTRLDAFLWFGGDSDDDNDGDSDSKREDSAVTDSDKAAAEIAANLQSIQTVMEQKLGRFQSSKWIGDKAVSIIADLAEDKVTASSTNGKVQVTFTGQQVPLSVTIDEQYLTQLLTTTGTKGATTTTTTKSSNSNINNKMNAKNAATELSLQITSAMKAAHAKSEAKLHDKLKALNQELMGLQ